MWWLLFFCSASNITNTIINYLNQIYTSQITGNQQILYTLQSVLYQDTIIQRFPDYKVVSVLSNINTNSLQIHYLKYYKDDTNAIYIESHQNPDFESISVENSKIEKQFAKIIGRHHQKLTLSSSQRQFLQVLPFHNIKPGQRVPQNFSLERHYLNTEQKEYVFYIQTNTTGSQESFYFSTSTVAEDPEKPSNIAIFLAVVFTFLVSCVVTYLVVYIYWAKKNTFPFVKKTEERARLELQGQQIIISKLLRCINNLHV